MSDPTFCANYKSRINNSLLPLLGIFRVTPIIYRPNKLSFLRNCKQMKFTDLGVKGRHSLTHFSPQGLILSLLHRGRNYNYYVCDPLRNQWLVIPQRNFVHHSSHGFSCEECTKDGVVHFKIFEALRQGDCPPQDVLRIETFSSRTGKWSKSFLTSPSKFFLGGNSHVAESVGGILYWKVDGHFSAYDPNLKGNRIWLIERPLPPPSELQEYCLSFSLGQSRDGCLRFAESYPDCLRVWDLRKKLSTYSLFDIVPSSEWIFKEEVSYINKLGIPDHSSFTLAQANAPKLLSFHPWHSEHLYLMHKSMVFLYDFETRTLEPTRSHGTVLAFDEVLPYFQPP